MAYTLLIDGLSGAGKTTLAKQIGAALGIPVVHCDEFYPGWNGLEEGARIVARDVLSLQDPGYWRWDWERNCRGEWVSLDPTSDLIVEGVGAVTEGSIVAARARGCVNTLWVDAAESLRRSRALLRDPEYARFWDMWAAQEKEQRVRRGAVYFDAVIERC
ncbi:hypothetical protein BJP08_07505 [Corynebacterium sp. NML140438]|uniref:hypothetical protein n=1 Tax=Corynebacterium sp. NML140438 TaxID=1906334 RepID=UPI0008FB2446|nr:hypothetical protein [Corynebacterium sp. NML140438]OIR41584.1 hypothetical protein BJP08_07505 [Corynebacterium sp. NML140438]